jgi:general secretion pathway protein G
MSTEQTTPAPQVDETARPSRLGRIVVAAVILVASVSALGIARLTFDSSLTPLQRKARAEIRSLEGRFKSYHRILGRFPTEEEAFQPLIHVGMLPQPPVDPWGRPYAYRMREGKGYVMSYGADGQPGGQGEAADIISGGILDSTQVGVQP